MNKKSLIIIGAIFLIILVLLLFPKVSELYSLNLTIHEFRLDTEVWNEKQKHPKERTKSATEFLNPPYLKKYNLNYDDYLDEKGYFSPDGHHWISWKYRTRAAAILMWKDTEIDLSIWELDKIIKQINKYYAKNNKSIPVIIVLNGVISKALRFQ